MDPARDPRARARPALTPPARTGEGPVQRLLRWLRPPRRLRPTRAGWVFFLLTFGVGFAALNTGNNLLYLVLSLMLAFLVLSGVLSESALRGIRVRRCLPRELRAEAPCRIGLEIRNDQRRASSFAVVIEDRRRDATGTTEPLGRVFALRIAPGAVERLTYVVVPTRRGRLEFAGFRVITRFPFGLFSKSLVLPVSETALVYPPVDPATVPPGFGEARRDGEALEARGGHGCDAAGLRDYEAGDSPRRVHWPASLRRRALVVREFESERGAEAEVRLRTRTAEPGEAFERSVRWAASEIVALLEAGRRVALRTDAEHLPADEGPRQRARLLAFLALVEPGEPRAEREAA